MLDNQHVKLSHISYLCIKPIKKYAKMEQVTILTNETDIKKIVNDIVNELKKNEQPIEEQPQERLLTSAETCAFLRCSKPTLHRMKKNGTIPFIRFGKNIRYKQSDLEKLIETKGK